MTGRAGSRRAAGPWAFAAVLLLLAGAVLVATLTGPVARGPGADAPQLPEVTPATASPLLPEAEESPSESPTPRPVPGPPSTAWTWVLLGGLAVLAVLVAFLLLSLRRFLPDDDVEDDEPAPGRAEPAGGPPPDRVVAAADAGLALLAGPGHVGDAVIACWVRLEEAAAATGRPRHPASTPSEFTAGLLVAGLGEEAPVRELLGLYHRARFGSRPLPPEAAERAAACLQAIRASAQSRAAAP